MLRASQHLGWSHAFDAASAIEYAECARHNALLANLARNKLGYRQRQGD
jgi:hypothetical protein